MSGATGNGIIRFAGECFPDNVYFQHSENGTFWHGAAGFTLLALIQSWIPQDIEVIHDLSQSNITYPVLQTAADGGVDIVADTFGQTYERYKLVDFAYPTDNSEVFIISSKNVEPTGFIFQGIYDTRSYILILFSFLIMIVVLNTSFSFFPKSRGDGKVSLAQITLHLFGNLWGQPFPPSVQSRWNSTQTSIYLFTFFNFVIATMYGSLVISKMTVDRDSNTIDTLEDLGAQREIRAYILKHSFVHEAIDNFKVLKSMKEEKRIDLISVTDFVDGEVFPNLRKKSHILIESRVNFEFFRSKLDDMALFCQNDPSTYHFSNELLFFSYSGWVYKKNFQHSESFNKYLMWLHAFGFTKKKTKQNSGIFSPKKMDYDCDFEDQEINYCHKYLDSSNNHKKLSILHLNMIFKYLGFGLGAATLIFLTELVYFNRRPSCPV